MDTFTELVGVYDTGDEIMVFRPRDGVIFDMSIDTMAWYRLGSPRFLLVTVEPHDSPLVAALCAANPSLSRDELQAAIVGVESDGSKLRLNKPRKKKP